MAYTFVGDGQTSTGDVLGSGDHQVVDSDTFNVVTAGHVYDTVINYGGDQVLAYGSSFDVTVNSGGQQDIEGSGTATDTVIGSGGNQYIFGSYDQYSNGDSTDHLTYGVAIRAVVGQGGVQNVVAYAHDSTIQDGGLQIVALPSAIAQMSGVVTGTTIDAGGTMFISSGLPEDTHINVGGIIELPQSDYSVAARETFDRATNILAITDGQTVTNLQLAGNYDQTAFSIDENGSANNSPQAIRITAIPLCFCAGVRIATPSGERPVEQIRVGDEVLNAAGRVRRIAWLGSQHVIVSDANRPVIVRADAFGEGVPKRDLRVTRGHSFLFNDVLIPVGELVNDLSILWDETSEREQLFHVGLATHDVLLADGAPAESYRDDGNGVGFTTTAGEPGASKAMPTFAPVVTHGPIVERTRRRLMEWEGSATRRSRLRTVA